MSFWDDIEDVGGRAGDALGWAWAWAKDTVTGSDENVSQWVNGQLAHGGFEAERWGGSWGNVGTVAAANDNPADLTSEGWQEVGNAVGREVAAGAKEIKEKVDVVLTWLPWVVGGGLAVGVVVLAVIYLPRPRG